MSNNEATPDWLLSGITSLTGNVYVERSVGTTEHGDVKLSVPIPAGHFAAALLGLMEDDQSTFGEQVQAICSSFGGDFLKAAPRFETIAGPATRLHWTHRHRRIDSLIYRSKREASKVSQNKAANNALHRARKSWSHVAEREETSEYGSVL